MIELFRNLFCFPPRSQNRHHKVRLTSQGHQQRSLLRHYFNWWMFWGQSMTLTLNSGATAILGCCFEVALMKNEAFNYWYFVTDQTDLKRLWMLLCEGSEDAAKLFQRLRFTRIIFIAIRLTLHQHYYCSDFLNCHQLHCQIKKCARSLRSFPLVNQA